MEDKTRMQKDFVNLAEEAKPTGPGSAFQSPICEEDKGQAGVENGE